MTYELSLTPNAKNDLMEIFNYIANDLQSIQNAKGQIDRLEQAINSLSYMPERFRVFDKEPWKSRNLRIMNVDNYQVFYIPNNDKKIVTVLRIIYGRRDVLTQLNQTL